mmetsp:Transcript_28226/g.51438  ORF Transcript_28226/g.51438 Transcript_28226/m.51438 type:complete len:94 (-) Transcript_28226:111-392(-)
MGAVAAESFGIIVWLVVLLGVDRIQRGILLLPREEEEKTDEGVSYGRNKNEDDDDDDVGTTRNAEQKEDTLQRSRGSRSTHVRPSNGCIPAVQ